MTEIASHLASECGTTHSGAEDREGGQDDEPTHMILLMSGHRA